MKKKFLNILMAVAIIGTSLTACNSDKATEENTDSLSMDSTAVEVDSSEAGVMVGGAMMVPSKNIVENAVLSNEHTTLVAAVTAADLATTLSGTGPFTVFAPTNAAFDALPAGTVDGLLKPEKKADLAGVLTYHVVAGALKAADLTDGMELTTVQGGKLKVSIKDGVVMVGDAQVTTADVISSNGVTHVINKVLLPK